jgi:Mg/Co/Ni transporter MgtE
VDWKNKQIKVSDLKQAEEVSLALDKGYVFVKREILDALLLDLENRSVIRANDLQIEESDGRLEIRAADTGWNPILRRISFGFYNYVGKKGLYDWKYVEFLRGDAMAVKKGAGYHLRITRMPPGDIVQLTNLVPYLHAAELLTLLPDPKAAKVLELMTVERQLQVIEELEETVALRLLGLMAPDAAADLIGMLKTDLMKLCLENLPRAKSERIIELLRYPEDTAGGIMTNDVVYFEADLTVAEARAKFRKRFSETDFVYLIYIVSDEENRTLRGRISVRDLLTADDDQKLESIMDPYIITLSSTDAAIEAAYRVLGSQMAAIPVVGLNNKLLGAITIDAAITEVTPTANSENLRIFS